MEAPVLESWGKKIQEGHPLLAQYLYVLGHGIDFMGRHYDVVVYPWGSKMNIYNGLYIKPDFNNPEFAPLPALVRKYLFPYQRVESLILLEGLVNLFKMYPNPSIEQIWALENAAPKKVQTIINEREWNRDKETISIRWVLVNRLQNIHYGWILQPVKFKELFSEAGLLDIDNLEHGAKVESERSLTLRSIDIGAGFKFFRSSDQYESSPEYLTPTSHSVAYWQFLLTGQIDSFIGVELPPPPDNTWDPWEGSSEESFYFHD